MGRGLRAFVTLGAVLFAGGGAAFGGASINATPRVLEVTTFFNGSRIRIEGTAPGEDGLAIVLSGPSQDIELKKKGKVWGILWMNVGDISFKEVPTVYMVASSGPLCELAPYEVRRRLRLGQDVLAEDSVESGSGEEGTRLFAELVKLKEQEGLYGIQEGALKVVPHEGADWTYSTSFELPARIPEGGYSLVLWGFSDGTATELARSEVTVAEAGVTREIAGFAMSRGLPYGVLAVIIALATGLLTGVLFGMAGKGGH